jgi:hypothetical protein
MAVGSAISGCGGDDSTVTDSGAPDVVTDTGAPDTSNDGTTQHDGTVADAHDASPSPDGEGFEGGNNNQDSGHMDAGKADAADAAPKADASDGAPPKSDGGDGGDGGDGAVVDAGSDVATLPPGLLAYPAQYANAICTGFSTCCGAGFDMAACEANMTTLGYDNTLPARDVYGNGHLTFNEDAGAGCLAALRTWPCGVTITSTQNAAILSACHGVLAGTIPVGGTGCNSSFECVNGAYCQPGSPTTCVAIVGDGGACSPSGESPDEQCAYIGSAQPGLYCDVYPNDGGNDAAGPTGVCAPALPDGVNSLCTDGIQFYSDYACANRGCDFANTGACSPAIQNPADPASQFYCADFVSDGGANDGSPE